MDITETRTRNLRLLVQRAGGPTTFGMLVGCAQVQVSQWTSGNAPKSVGSRLARDIEERLGYQRGWLDHAQWSSSTAPVLDPALLSEAFTIMDDTDRAAGHTFSLRNQKDAGRLAQFYTWRSHMRRDPTPQEWMELGRKIAKIGYGGGGGQADPNAVSGNDAGTVAGSVRNSTKADGAKRSGK